MTSYKEVDWLDLWRELAAFTAAHPLERVRTPRFELHARKKSERPDPLLDTVLRDIDAGSTVVDIGAGSGRWTIPIARKARSVTAVEPCASIRELLQKNLSEAGVGNVTVLPVSWEDAVVPEHEIVVCAHAMYGSLDFASFIRKMEQSARKRCYLALRLPPHDGIIGQLCFTIYGHRHDSPNAIIAYNALYSLSIYCNMIVEGGMHAWVDTTLDEAFLRAKRHLHLKSCAKFDELVRRTLVQRLVYANNSYIWPDGMRSALLWWSPHSSRGLVADQSLGR